MRTINTKHRLRNRLARACAGSAQALSGLPDRRGVTVIEMAVVAPLVLMLLLGMVDLGIGVYAYNTVAESARAGARYAAVHGSRSSSPTGPSSNDAKVASVVKSYTPALSSSELTIKSDWPDGNNDPQSKVTVTVEYNYRMAVTWFMGFKSLKLTGTSTMVITH